MTRFTYGSLFSGVGGMDLGFDTHMDCVFQVEWDKNCQSILRRHWPDVPKWDDVQDVNGAELPPCDVLTFGSPCQDLSVAGKRAGLDGSRSSMFFEAIRIIKEMRDATSSRPDGPFPRIAVWENVPGALSSNGSKDFGVVLDELARVGAVEIEWGVLDAQHFGVPQRRRRVFVVAVFDPATAERCPDPLLPVAEGRPRDFAKGRKKRKTDPPATPDSPPIGRIMRTPRIGVYVEDDLASCISQRDHKSATDIIVTAGSTLGIGIAAPLTSNAKGGLRTTDIDGATFISEHSNTYALRRLTPLECERLMGWPDDHTRYTDTGKEQADTHRYRQCGNGVATPVARWIAGHLKAIL